MREPEEQNKASTESYTPKDKPEIPSLVQQAALATDMITDPFMGGEPPRTSNRIKNYRRIQNWENYFLSSCRRL